jgi:hypothetical protein
MGGVASSPFRYTTSCLTDLLHDQVSLGAVTFEILSGVTLWQRSTEVNNQELFAFRPAALRPDDFSEQQGTDFCCEFST